MAEKEMRGSTNQDITRNNDFFYYLLAGLVTESSHFFMKKHAN